MQITQETSLLNTIKSGTVDALKDVVSQASTEAVKAAALFYAARHKEMQMVDYLLTIDAPLRKDAIVPLVENCVPSHLRKAIPLDAPSEIKQEALLFAVEFKRLDMVVSLLNHGADPHAKIGNTSAFDIAERDNAITIARFILERSPFKNKDGALLRAVKKKRFRMAELLLQNVSPLQNPTSLDEALVTATKLKDIGTAKLLLEHGANTLYRTEHNQLFQTALDCAYYSRDPDLIDLFKQYRATRSFKLNDAIDEMIHLGRVWGIIHEWKGFSSEGESLRNLPHTAIARALEVFVKENPKHDIQRPEKIISAFKLADELPDLDTQLANIKKNELVVISTGYFRHALTLLFWRGFYGVCQRTGQHTKGIEIDSSKMTKGLLEEIYTMTYKTPQQTAENLFYNTLMDALKKRNIKFCIRQKEQQGGFCSWNSPEAALFTILSLQNTNELKRAKQVYKDCTTFFRLFFTNEYIDKILKREFDFDEFIETTSADGYIIRIPPPDAKRYEYLDYDLLKIIQNRLEGNWHPERFDCDYLKKLKAKTLKKIRIARNNSCCSVL